MTFLNPGYLYGLFLALIPVLIHILNRRKKVRIDFSTIRFLKELEHKRIKTIKLKQIILLILRTLIICLIVFAFSRPSTKGFLPFNFDMNSKTTVLIVVDNSFSTNALIEKETLFAYIKQKADEILTNFNDGDEIYVLPLCPPPEIDELNPVYSINTAQNILSKIGASYFYGDFIHIKNHIEEIFQRSLNLNKELYFITDLQRTGFKEELREENEFIKKNIYLVDVSPENIENISVADIKPENQILEKGKEISFGATIRNHSQYNKSDIFTSAFIGGERVAQKNIDINSNFEEIAVFKSILEKTGFLECSIEIEDDPLIEDNVRNFSLHVPEQIKIMYINNSPVESDYFKLALNPEHINENFITVEEYSSIEITNINYNDFSIIAYHGFPLLSEKEIFNLKSFLNKGGSLIIFPTDESDLNSYNREISNIFKLPKIIQIRGEKGNNEKFLTLSNLDFSHPIFKGIFQKENSSINIPHFFLSLSFEKSSKAEHIIEFANRDPFILECKWENGKIILFASALDLTWTDLPVKGIYVPLINRLIHYLASGESTIQRNYIVGNEILYSSKKEYKDIEIEKPDGSVIKLIPQISGDNVIIRFANTDEPGIYRLYSSKKLIHVFAVNSNPEESDLTKIEISELSEKLKNENIIIITNRDDPVKIIKESRFGKELSKYVIYCVLILLVFEMLLSNERNRDEIE